MKSSSCALLSAEMNSGLTHFDGAMSSRGYDACWFRWKTVMGTP